MHRSRNSEILLTPNSPFYRGRDNYSYDYVSERPFELSRRSRSLECNRDFLRDSYYDDYDDRKFERTDMINATLPRRRYEYQPFFMGSQPRETRFFHDEPMRLQAIEAVPAGQHYSPRQIDYDWRYERSYRDKAGSPVLSSPPRDDYDYRGASSLYNGGVQQRSYSTWNRSYYTEPATTIAAAQPAITSPNTTTNNMLTPGIPQMMNGSANGNGYYTASNTLNKSAGYIKPGYTKSGYLRRDNRELRYRMIHCCCFHFRWPPWGVEDAEPPRPMYRHY